MYVCVGYVHMNAGGLRGQKNGLDVLELELQVAVNYPAWMPGTELGPLPEQ